MNQEKKTAVQERTDFISRIISDLKNDTAPWRSGMKAPRLAVNAVTGKTYSGLNLLSLSFCNELNEIDNRWMTFKQAKDKGYHVKKGATGEKVYFYRRYDTVTKKDFNSITIDHLSDDEKFLYIRDKVKHIVTQSTVFNATQIDGIPPQEQRIPINLDDFQKHLINNSEASIIFTPKRANSYNPKLDRISISNIENWESLDILTSTLVHEIIHSTGHESRLNRDLKHKFGSPEYAKEELIAELGTVLTMAEYGLAPDPSLFENNKAYIKSWIVLLEDKPSLLNEIIKEAEQAFLYTQERIIEKENGNNRTVVINSEPSINQESTFSAKSYQQKNNIKPEMLFETKLVPTLQKELDSISRNDIGKPNAYLNIAEKTPFIFEKLGLPEAPVRMYRDKIARALLLPPSNYNRKQTHGHTDALNKEILFSTFSQLANPYYVFKSKDNQSLIGVYDIFDKNREPVILILKHSKNRNTLTANLVTSVYGKREQVLEMWAKEGLLIYSNNIEKATDLAYTLQVRIKGKSVAYNEIIRLKSEFVKLDNEIFNDLLQSSKKIYNSSIEEKRVKNIELSNEDISIAQKLIPSEQLKTTLQLCNGEEGDFFKQKILDVVNIYKNNSTWEKENIDKNGEHPLLFHYFHPCGTDIYLSEIDKDLYGFGYTILNGDYQCSEFGDSFIPEIIKIPNMELDYNTNARDTIEKALFHKDNYYFEKPLSLKVPGNCEIIAYENSESISITASYNTKPDFIPKEFSPEVFKHFNFMPPAVLLNKDDALLPLYTLENNELKNLHKSLIVPVQVLSASIDYFVKINTSPVILDNKKMSVEQHDLISSFYSITDTAKIWDKNDEIRNKISDSLVNLYNSSVKKNVLNEKKEQLYLGFSY